MGKFEIADLGPKLVINNVCSKVKVCGITPF